MGRAVLLHRGGSVCCQVVGLRLARGCPAWFVLACPQDPETRVRKCPKSERAALPKSALTRSGQGRLEGQSRGRCKPGGSEAALGVRLRS